MVGLSQVSKLCLNSDLLDLDKNIFLIIVLERVDIYLSLMSKKTIMNLRLTKDDIDRIHRKNVTSYIFSI